MGLSTGGYILFIKFRTYLQGTVCLGGSFLYGVQPTSRGLLTGSAACFPCSQPTSRGLSPGGSFFFTVSNPSSRELLAVGVETVYKVKNLYPGEYEWGAVC